MNLSSLRGKLVISVLLGAIVFIALAAYGDFKNVGSDLLKFKWELLPLILVVTFGNYALRFVKWQYYLGQIGVTGLKRSDSFLIYFSGLGMTVTPGKAGEWLKSHLLKEVHGTPVSRSTPILIAERLTDSLGLLIIAGAGVIVFGRNTWPVVAVFGLVAIVAVTASRNRKLSYWCLHKLANVPVVKRLEPHFEEFYESTYVLMHPRGVVMMTGLSVASWFCEVMAFYLTLVGFGVSGSFDTLFKAAFILPIATLAAALLFTPGGLGVAEGGITSLSERLLDMGKSAATASTLVVRVATLWFGVVLGLLMFAVLTRRMARRGISLEADVNAGETAEEAQRRTLAGGDAAG